MVKVFVIYDTKYGNTKLAAEKIAEGIREVGEIETAVGYVKEIEVAKIADYDALILGAPNHMGRPSRTMKKFVNRLAELDLKANNVAVFGTYSGRERTVDRAVKKLADGGKEVAHHETNFTWVIRKGEGYTWSFSGGRTS